MSTKEAIDMSGSRRRASAPKAGSVWESRMKLDEVKGGIKVFNATQENSEQITQNNRISTISTVTNTEIQMDKKEKEVTPKQSPNGASGKRKTWKSEGSPLQIARKRSELSKNLDEQSKELSVSASDGIFKTSPVLIKKTRSVSFTDGNGKNGVGLRKLKSGFTEVVNDGKSGGDSDEKNIKNEQKAVLDGPSKDLEGCNGGMRKSRSDEEFGVCEEKGITSDVGRMEIKNPSSDSDSEFVDGEEAVDDDEDKEIEVEKKSIEKITVQEQMQKRIVIEEKKLLYSNKKAVPVSPIIQKQSPPAVNHARFHPSPTESKPNNFHGIPRSNSKLQSFVDLVMWRDASKSAFVFGIGTFSIISSSYTKDLNISFISVVSYLGLVYLAAIFLFRSLVSRAAMDNADQDYVVGEEEAIWVVKLLLPFVNEFLLKLRALFSGDPATTMKLAVLLFILARCGSSITIWKMAKLGFIGVFTVPKICSTYSAQLTAYGTFWIRRFGDAWESCSHKKAVGFAIFTLVWNLSSVVARIWAVFMLFAAFKYYQQSLVKEEFVSEEATGSENSYYQGQSIGGQRRGPTRTELRKQKKVY